MVSICAAFFTCSGIVRKALEEADQYPTSTYIEDVEIDRLESPSVSILAPKRLSEDARVIRRLNEIHVCDVDVNRSSDEVLKAYLPVLRKLNRFARAPVWTQWEYQVYQDVKDLFDFSVYPRFCAMATEMDSDDFENVTAAMKASLDGIFFVSNVTSLLQEFIPEKPSSVPDDCLNPLGNFKILGRWLDIVAPAEHR